VYTGANVYIAFILPDAVAAALEIQAKTLTLFLLDVENSILF